MALSPSQKRDAEVDAGFDEGFMSSEPHVERAGALTPRQIGFQAGTKARDNMLAKVFGEPEAGRDES